MTKIKDLVTVHADTAVSMFPLDFERYELVVAISRILTSLDGDMEKLVFHEDSRIREFLQMTLSNFNLGAQSMEDAWGEFADCAKPITIDRARRCEAAYTTWIWLYSDPHTPGVTMDVMCLWLELMLRLMPGLRHQYQHLSLKGHGG